MVWSSRPESFAGGGPSAIMVLPALVIALMSPSGPVAAQDRQAPEAVGTIPNLILTPGQSATVNLLSYFNDPNGDEMVYAATTSDGTTATVFVRGSTVIIEGVAGGTVTMTVFASDPGGLSATQRTRVTVEAGNRAPEPVGTIPLQNLSSGQWASIDVSSYFNDPDGDELAYAAGTSSAAVVTVAVSGSTVRISEVAPGTATVTVMASDPGGLSAQQMATVTVTAGQAREVSAQPGTDPAQPGTVTADPVDAQSRSVRHSPSPDPVPPRLLVGFLESTGRTLARGQGHFSAGYLGTSVVAQVGDFLDIVPYVAHAAYGVSDNLTIAVGSGFYHDVDGREIDFFPYYASKFRVLDNEQASVAVGGHLGLLVSEENLVYFGVSGMVSRNVVGGFVMHGGAGLLGFSESGVTDTDGVFSIGGEFSMDPRIRLVGEFRRVGVEDGSNVLSAGLRFLGATLGGEVGLAYWLEDAAEIRPIVSLGYRF